MNERQRKIGQRLRRRRHIRKRVYGQADRPRLRVYRSNRNVYVQAIDDVAGRTLAAASTHAKELAGQFEHGGSVKAASAVGQLVARRLRMQGIDAVVFDRGGYRYHGRIKALADAARAEGLKF